ncbi:hypothetical protein BWD09_00665 [Neisseria dentiae]|uniref:Uncharacterized protein n=1 Tax=Neisseria dentiae TaxID=194197 RepID=A0A1X3DGA6_9NEIS|nr:putative phage abortive infection protein [Neisseria dentiae]OSI18805.1 hypothetical protein BWD09_00665 [Neisseria dentiae]STZ52334.1 Uncharacterised protein [Neisseria dentiae]
MINWLIALGTIASAIGLIYFSFLTYKNQKNNEFHSLFKVLLDEHNRLLNLLEITELKEVNESIIDIFSESECCISHENNIQFNNKVEEKIDSYSQFKPYLITLFRLLKLISLSEKIHHADKKEYYGLVRGLISSEILFLVLFNSLSFRDENDYPNYTNLIIEAKLFEHLPITEEWIYKQYISNSEENLPKLIFKAIELRKLIEYIFSGELINLEAFGKSIYLKKYQTTAKNVLP